ncbi:MAG: GNAT family N-acetyltransferase [Cyanobacteria bacterium REEB494]|nr:GNAT family N-acetyltransferase [Cyanobacteria bacterium REEB494]
MEISDNISENIIATPWDSRALGINTFEIIYTSDFQLRNTLEKVVAQKRPGHYTVKINPFFSKKLLHDFGFYYCDTLLEPYCGFKNLIFHKKDGIEVESASVDDFQKISSIIYDNFKHDRFHRDFNIDQNIGDLRYNLWLKDLCSSNQVFSLKFFGDLAGFWAYSNNKILLHALNKEYQGQGLSKYFWSLSCQELFENGYQELTSSISASNVRVLNLYSSLGFNFRNPLDVYHFLLE